MRKLITIFAVTFFGILAAMAENVNITAKLKDANNQSVIIGATVLLMQDTALVAGTTTDNKGKFVLDTQTGEYVLECSFVGYETIRMALTVSGNTNLGDILLSETATELEEVVVESQGAIQKVDRQILLPNKEQMAASSDGVSLLQNLQIPRIVINPVENTIKTLSDESDYIKIKGE